MEKLYIYSEKHHLTEGIYGQCLAWLLELLNNLIENNKINDNTRIIFDINTLNNNNLIPNFIVPKNIYTFKIDDTVNKISLLEFKQNNKISFKFNEHSYEIANNIFNKFFKFNNFINNQIHEVNLSSKSLGIHYRGTDKNFDNGQSNSISCDEFLLIIDDYLKKNDVSNIFCCSDEEIFISKIKKKYPEKIIEYKQLRSNNSKNFGFFRNGQYSSESIQNDLTNNSIIDMLLLSQCNTIIKTSSALSCFSKIINPNINLYCTAAMKQKWFPAGLVKPYNSESKIIQKILQKTMAGHVYN